ncbi:insulin receptor substrate 1-like isoform X2 [Anneissia japonica]|uniref:insulin receptor substrate 1-like isoform X2 n=1 Tax=Anneissia japonica TaxID=1529436 RepID=UPI0014257921|nr:insulin receptor substrate 1-like isoform X2 [Anneissia japonica]
MTENSRLTSTPPADANVKDSIIKTGYLLKYKTMKRKFFVLRCSPTGIPTLEYYDSEKKFLNGATSKRAIQLNCCFNINKKNDTKHKYVIALYTRNDCFCMVLENEQMQEEWLEALIMQQPNRENNKSVPAFEHIWQVRLNPKKGIGSSQNRSGNYQLCLTRKTVHLVKMLSDGDGDLEFPLSTIRRCGHSDCFFFMEVGRQAPTGSGELWMQVDDTVIAQNIHEATLNAMQSINQLEEMRPRSHSNNSNDNKPHRRTTPGLIPSRRNRCDSMPAHLSQPHINSDREEAPVRDEHVPHSPASLMKISSKVRPRTASEGEFHYRGGRTPDSPSRNRQKFPPARSNSNVFRPPNMFPKSVIKSNSDSPPIPNSPLSESPQSFLDSERYTSIMCHSPDGSMDEYSSSPLDSLHRYGRTPESPTPTPIREESFESDEYINMSPSASSQAMPVPRSSVGIDKGIFHYHDAPVISSSGGKQTSSYEAVNLYSPMNMSACDASSNSEEKQVYMNMEPTASKSRITATSSLDVPTNHKPNKDKLRASSSHDEGYIMMVPKIENKERRRLSNFKKQSSREDQGSRPGSRLSQKSTSTDSQDSYMFMSPTPSEGQSKESKLQAKDKKSSKDGKTSTKSTRPPRTNGTSQSQSRNNVLLRSKPVSSDNPQEAYVNVDFDSQTEKIGSHSIKRNDSDARSQKFEGNTGAKIGHGSLAVTVQSPSLDESDVYTMMAPATQLLDKNNEDGVNKVRSRNDLLKMKELDKNENVQIEYMNINFGGKNEIDCRLGEGGRPSSPHTLDPSSDYMNVGFRTVKSQKSPIVPVSPIVDSHTLDLTDCIKNMSFPSGGMRNLVEMSPGNGKTAEGLGPPSHNSSRRSSQTSLQEERELNYVDVDISHNDSNQPSDDQRSRSPFARRSENEKPDQSITYASIDFTKSEGLRSTQNLRESRF